jgi:hypothetical protein
MDTAKPNTLKENQSPNFASLEAAPEPPPIDIESSSPISESQTPSNTVTYTEATDTPSTQEPLTSKQDTASDVIMTSGDVPKDKKFMWIIGGIAGFALILWLGVGYLYYSNQTLESIVMNNNNRNLAPPRTPTPTPEPLAEQIAIGNGSVIRTLPNGDTTTLVDKDAYPTSGLIGFLNVDVSPDNRFMCFESRSPAPAPAMYIANTDGTELTEISPNRVECLWAQNSQAVLYTSTAITTKSTDIFMYDLTTKVETNLTQNVQPEEGTRQYLISALSEDGTSVECIYKDYGSEVDPIAEGSCLIDLTTNEVILQ